MDAFVEQIIGTTVFVKLQNGEMKEMKKADLPKGIRVDDMLIFENGQFRRDPDASSKKANLAKELEELMKSTFKPVTTYTDKDLKK